MFERGKGGIAGGKSATEVNKQAAEGAIISQRGQDLWGSRRGFQHQHLHGKTSGRCHGQREGEAILNRERAGNFICIYWKLAFSFSIAYYFI